MQLIYPHKPKAIQSYKNIKIIYLINKKSVAFATLEIGLYHFIVIITFTLFPIFQFRSMTNPHIKTVCRVKFLVMHFQRRLRHI